MLAIIDFRQDFFDGLFAFVLERIFCPIALAGLIEDGAKFAWRKRAAYLACEKRGAELFHEAERRLDIPGGFDFKCSGVTGDREIELGAKALDLF